MYIVSAWCLSLIVSNVGLVGWNSKNATGARVTTDGTAAVTASAAVLSCEGRLSRNSSTTPTRGVWLREGQITRLANLALTGVNFIPRPRLGMGDRQTGIQE